VSFLLSPLKNPPRIFASIDTLLVMYAMLPASAYTISPGAISMLANCRLSPVMLYFMNIGHKMRVSPD